MICHGWYPCFEPEKTPATLSRRVVTDLLRNELGFDGLIMTDDLDMGAILTGYRLEETIRLAIAAGNDLVMICHRIPEIENVHRILGTLPPDQTDRALAKRRAVQEKDRAASRILRKPPFARSTMRFGTCVSRLWAKSAPKSAASKAPNARQWRCSDLGLHAARQPGASAERRR